MECNDPTCRFAHSRSVDCYECVADRCVHLDEFRDGTRDFCDGCEYLCNVGGTVIECALSRCIDCDYY